MTFCGKSILNKHHVGLCSFHRYRFSKPFGSQSTLALKEMLHIECTKLQELPIAVKTLVHARIEYGVKKNVPFCAGLQLYKILRYTERSDGRTLCTLCPCLRLSLITSYLTSSFNGCCRCLPKYPEQS